MTTVDQLGRPVAAELSIAVVDQSLLRLFGELTAADRPVLLRPDPHRRLRHRSDQHVSLCTRHDGRRLGPGRRARTPGGRALPTPPNRNGVVADLAKPQGNCLRDGRRQRASSGRGSPMHAGATRRARPNLVARPAAKKCAGERAMSATGAGLERFDDKKARAARRRRFGKDVELCGKAGDVGERDGPAGGSTSSRSIARPGRANPLSGETSTFDGNKSRKTRERFVETAYWNPMVVTGKDGKARVSFKAPSRLSEYRITARGVTGADTLAGQTTATLTVRKKLLRRPQGPRIADAGRQAAVRRPGPPHRRRRQARAWPRDLRRRSRRGFPQDDRAHQGRRRRGHLRAVRGPRRRDRSADAQGHHRRRERRADGRGADPALGRRGDRVRVRHQQRKHDRLRGAARRANV